ncbi:MAG: diguanylate cyclase [Candidatus Dadabacteria bacterium]|nr:diguanylate cyclase [Candidatus Dadabacteria bacterium]
MKRYTDLISNTRSHVALFWAACLTFALWATSEGPLSAALEPKSLLISFPLIVGTMLAHRLTGISSSIHRLTSVEKAAMGLLAAVALETVFSVAGRGLFPLTYIVAPLAVLYTGWRGAIAFASLTVALELTFHMSGTDTLYRLFPLPIATFFLGFIMKTHLGSRSTRTKSPLHPDNDIPFLSAFEHGYPGGAGQKNLTLQYRDSVHCCMSILQETLPTNSIVLYMRRHDGFFEIEDFIAGENLHIDRTQKVHLRGGYPGWVLKTKTPVVVGNIKNSSDNLIYYHSTKVPVKSIIVVPILTDGPGRQSEGDEGAEPIGVLIVDSLSENAFGEREGRLASLVATRIVETLNRYKLAKKMELNSQGLASFYDLSTKLSSSLEPNTILNHVTKSIADSMEADVLGITLADGHGERSILMRTGLNRREDIEGKEILHSNTLVGLVAETGTPFFTPDLSSRKKFKEVFGREVDFALKMGELSALLILPMHKPLTRGEFDTESTMGCIVIGKISGAEGFSRDQRKLAEIMAKEASKALWNSISYEEVKELAITDSLTGLYNFRYFQEELNKEIARTDRFPGKVSLILLDIDNFKELNDTYGHPVGNMALKSIAEALKSSTRKIDTPARYGGDEFAILLPNTNEQSSKTVAEKIKARVKNINWELQGLDIQPSVSIGVATYPDSAYTKEQLFKLADCALYEAKHSGRNNYVHYGDIEHRENSALIAT